MHTPHGRISQHHLDETRIAELNNSILLDSFDCTSFLWAKGFQPTIYTVAGSEGPGTRMLFGFAYDKELAEEIKAFLRGDAQVNVKTLASARYSLRAGIEEARRGVR